MSIECVQSGTEYWSFSLLSLLSMLHGTKIKQINITGYNKIQLGRTWLYFVWNKRKLELQQAYKDKGYVITFYDDGTSDAEDIENERVITYCIKIEKI